MKSPMINRALTVLTLLAMLASVSVIADTHYADAASLMSTPPFTNWATAATNIQNAVDASEAGDVVLVTNGYYVLPSELWVEKAIQIRSVNGARYTTLDGGNTHRCLAMTDSGALMEGFSLVKGYGVSGNYVAGTLKKCIIRDCYATSVNHPSGAIYLGGAGRLENCLIFSNKAECTVPRDTTHGTAGVLSSGGTIVNCTITRNTLLAGHGGGGYQGAYDKGGLIQNCIIWGNVSPDGADVGVWSRSTFFKFCCMPADVMWTENRIPGPPQFVNAAAGDFRQKVGSPCIDVGTTESWMTDATDLEGVPRIREGNGDGTVAPDIGAYEFSFPAGSNLLQITASPATHGIPKPLGYGYQIVAKGPAITNRVGLMVEEKNGVVYACRGWNGSGITPAAGSGTSAVFAISEYYTNAAVLSWQWQKRCWLNLEVAGGGSVDQSDQWVDLGSNVIVTATAETGYRFTGWSGGVTDTANPVSIIMDGPKSVTANFALNVITVLTDRASVSIPEGGSAGFQVRLSAQPAGDTVVAAARTDGDTDVIVTGATSLTFSVSNWDSFQTVTLSAAEDDGDNVNGTATITCGRPGIVEASVEATETDDDVILEVNSLYGTVFSNPQGPCYEKGTPVSLTAMPAPSYAFKNWTGDLANTNNPSVIMMNADKTVTANYSPWAPFLLPPSRIAPHTFKIRVMWEAGGAPEGELGVASNAAFTRFVPGYEARYVVNRTECLVTNLQANRDYWCRARRVMPDASVGPWSSAMKVRTGFGMPVFKNLLSEVPVSKGITQEFAISNLVTGTGTLRVKSSDTNAVKATVSSGVLKLQYLWKAPRTAAKVTMTLSHPSTRYKVSYGTRLRAAEGSIAIVGKSALTNAGIRVAQEVTLKNLTGSMVYGLRVRVTGLSHTTWLVNRTGLDPVTQAPIREIPCVLPVNSQMVVRLVYNKAYTTQAATAPAKYAASAIVTPVGGAGPVSEEMIISRQDRYDGLWLLGFPVNRNRLYSVFHSDDEGAAWTLDMPVVRAMANDLQWLDMDEEAPSNRLYRVMDTGI